MSKTDSIVETQLCKLRGTPDAFVQRFENKLGWKGKENQTNLVFGGTESKYGNELRRGVVPVDWFLVWKFREPQKQYCCSTNIRSRHT